MHICSAIMDTGPGPKTKAQKLLAGPGGPQVLGLGHGPGPLFIMAEYMCITGNQQAMYNSEYITGDVYIYIYIYMYLYM